ncbi:enoyl-CoA hydratase/isomerase family protein [Pseudonocardia endophytica]|uniref:Enoyl-CoA hydratase/carnithine racemase n=1 Tax=Pseudonocardia endophytica TaxID=401976 RepID=A0A4R1I4N1_PSEEN|nr:enoyl-CoA hydratase/isomerase family protein [Pseudonocardia endophytica]TCK27539.1 enoyl-CoA hydratase/carnithine racemase [Pseudonocardia endophytica]
MSALRIERDGAVARLVLARPERHNAQTPQLWAELRTAGAALVDDGSVRAAVVAADGPSFSSGLDLGEREPGGFLHRVAHAGDDGAMAAIAEAQAAFTWIGAAPFPVVAAVRGYAIGAGIQLALACDVRIVAPDATLAVAEVGLGAVPDLGATTALPRLVGLGRALDLVLTARRFDGVEAVAMGLALRTATDVDADAMAYAQALAAAPRAALAATKAATRASDPDVSLAIAARGQVECVRAMYAR